jgi:hypothetical protein
MAVVQQAWFRNRRWAWSAPGAGPARSHFELSGLSQIEIEGKRYDFDVVIERSRVRRRWGLPAGCGAASPRRFPDDAVRNYRSLSD